MYSHIHEPDKPQVPPLQVLSIHSDHSPVARRPEHPTFALGTPPESTVFTQNASPCFSQSHIQVQPTEPRTKLPNTPQTPLNRHKAPPTPPPPPIQRLLIHCCASPVSLLHGLHPVEGGAGLEPFDLGLVEGVVELQAVRAAVAVLHNGCQGLEAGATQTQTSFTRPQRFHRHFHD